MNKFEQVWGVGLAGGPHVDRGWGQGLMSGGIGL